MDNCEEDCEEKYSYFNLILDYNFEMGCMTIQDVEDTYKGTIKKGGFIQPLINVISMFIDGKEPKEDEDYGSFIEFGFNVRTVANYLWIRLRFPKMIPKNTVMFIDQNVKRSICKKFKLTDEEYYKIFADMVDYVDKKADYYWLILRKYEEQYEKMWEFDPYDGVNENEDLWGTSEQSQISYPEIYFQHPEDKKVTIIETPKPNQIPVPIEKLIRIIDRIKEQREKFKYRTSEFKGLKDEVIRLDINECKGELEKYKGIVQQIKDNKIKSMDDLYDEVKKQIKKWV